MKISATIITLNEEKNIRACLDSLDFVDEVIVVDSGSTDKTAEICNDFEHVKFFSSDWEGYGKQKNNAAELAAYDWILNVDADERVSTKLAQSILNADFDSYNNFRVARENYFGDRWIKYCGWYPDYNVRLYNRKKSRFSERAVHEAVDCKGDTGHLDGNLIHRTYTGVSDYLKRMDRYSTLAAKQMIQEGRRPGKLSIVSRPLATFLKMYIMKQGFREGYYGFLISSLYTVYTFSKYTKALEYAQEKSNDVLHGDDQWI